jgi:hypothetical protein
MIEREYEILIQEVLDGQATTEQRARLEAYLSKSEQGRTRKRELEAFFEALQEVEAVSPPADLKEAVLHTLQSRAAGADRRIPRRDHLKLAFVFAAGLAAGVLTMGALTGVLSPQGPGGEPPVSGAMMPLSPPTGAVRKAFQAGHGRVEAVSWKTGANHVVGLQVAADNPLAVELRFDPRRVEAGAVRQSRQALGRVEMASGRVLIQAEARSEYIVEFQGASPGTTIQLILRSGSESAGGDLPLPAER